MLTDVSDANKSYTKLEVSEKSDLDLIAVKVLRKDCPDFLFPLKMMEIDGETEIRYELTDGVRFCYMPTQMKKREFIELLTNLIQPFKACSDWFLDYHNFVLDENYILVGKNEQSVKYIYVPTKSQTNSDQEIISFFAGLILKMDIKDDQSYTVDLLRVIKSSNANLMTLLEHLQKDHVEKKAAPLAPPKPAEDHMKKIVSFVQDIPEKMAEKKEKQEPVKAEKPAETKAEPVKAEPAKKIAAKKETAKKETAKKTTAKKTVKAEKPAVTQNVYVQFAGLEISTADLTAKVTEEWVALGHRASSIKSLDLYVKPEDMAAYYVINGKESGKIAL